MASPSTVITLGYGSFGSVNLLPTLGFGIAEVVLTSEVPLDASFRGNRGKLHSHTTQRKLGTKATGKFHYEDQESTATE